MNFNIPAMTQQANYLTCCLDRMPVDSSLFSPHASLESWGEGKAYERSSKFLIMIIIMIMIMIMIMISICNSMVLSAIWD